MQSLAIPVYCLCLLAAFGCAWLLLRSHRRSRSPLLLWSGLCFCGLTITNSLRVVDLVFVPDVDLFIWRNLATLVSMLLLLYGLIWETTR